MKDHRFNAIMQCSNVSYTHLLLLNENKLSVINARIQMKIMTIFFTDFLLHDLTGMGILEIKK